MQILENYLNENKKLNFDYTTIDHNYNKLCTSCHVIKFNDNFRIRPSKNKIDTYSSHVCKQCETSYSIDYNILHDKERKNYNKIRTENGKDLEMRYKRALNHTKQFLLNKAKQNAKIRNREFNITIDDIIIPEKCPLLEIPLQINIGKGGAKDNSYSIDRIDSSKGYIKGNIQIMSKLANVMKNSATQKQLITFSKNILKLYKDEDIV